MNKIKALMLAAILGALANILAFPPIAIPLSVGSFESSIHFSQVPIFICGALAGPFYGMIAGTIGGLFMATYLPGIPFIFIGLAILGLANGFFTKKLRPGLSGIMAWCVQAPYVVVTDYIWFTMFLNRTTTATWIILSTIMIKLTIEAVISAVLADILVNYIKKAGFVSKR
ncbi:MAG: ECF transporter S component [Candidatus Bathyarchaeota archaeon]|nr:MAG: ECF transporter S component [Candidatus Bathyarchaeota archaeon]